MNIKVILKFFFVAVILAGLQAQGASYSSSFSSFSGGGDGNFHLGWTALRYDHTTNYAGDSSTDSQVLNIGTKLGYSWGNGFYLGALYESDSSYYNATSTPTPDTRISYGPTIGYYAGGFFILGTYFTNTSYTMSNGDSYSGGSGYQAELGYNYSLAANFYMGLSLVYNSFTWNQYTTGATTKSQTNAQTDVYPALGIGFLY